MKVNNRCLLCVVSTMLILFTTFQVHAQTLEFESSSATNPMTSQFNHTLALERQARQYYLNDTQTMIAIKLAENSTQFQTAVMGYNYTFSSVYSALGSGTQGGMELKGYHAVFELYKGPVVGGYAIRKLDVSMDSSLSKVFNATSYQAEYTDGYLPANSSTVPEFPFAVPILVIGISSLLIFSRIKLKF